MPDYISFPIESNPDTLQQDAYDFIQSKFPSWEPSEGNFEAFLIAAVSQMVSDLMELATDVPTSIFRYFGAYVIGVPPVGETAAAVDSTWTMVDNAGYTITAGTLVAIPDDNGELHAFEVLNDVTINPSSTATAAGAVALQSVETGAVVSGLGGIGVNVPLLDPLAYVSSVVLTGVTTGGKDAETDEDYLNRLSEYLTLLAPRPILPADFALMAKSIAGVHRAAALDGFNGSTYNNEKTVAIAAVDEAGEAVPSGTKTAIGTYLESLREDNFVVYMMDPTYTTVDVQATVVKLAGTDETEVDNAVTDAITAYLSPANWGTGGEGASDTRGWSPSKDVRYLELATLINNVSGVDYITSLGTRVPGGSGSYTTTDKTLSGDITLPRAGAIDVMVT